MTIENKSRARYLAPGLTLIEMLVSLSVVMLVTTIFVYNYQDNNKRTDLIMSSQVLVSDIHRTQNNALGLKRYGEEVPSGGWGLYFDTSTPNKYIMYPVLQDPNTYGYSLYNPNTGVDVDKGGRIIELPRGIEISNIYFKDNYIKDKASLSFLPPDPRVNIYDSRNSSSTELYVQLEDLRNGGTKTIFINFLGLAEVID